MARLRSSFSTLKPQAESAVPAVFHSIAFYKFLFRLSIVMSWAELGIYESGIPVVEQHHIGGWVTIPSCPCELSG